MDTIDAKTTRQVLTALAGHGPYFTVDVRAERPRRGGWRPVGDLYAGTDLGELVDVTSQRLGTDDARVAGSTLHQGYAARVWSLVVGAAVAGGVVPRLDDLWWRSTDLSLVELLAVEPTGTYAAGADRVAEAALTDHIHPLTRAVRAATGVSWQVLTGNTASALVGALRVLAGTDVDAAARDLAAALLARPDLRDAGTAYLATSPARFERASCCLYYRLDRTALCGDCVLVNRSSGGSSS